MSADDDKLLAAGPLPDAALAVDPASPGQPRASFTLIAPAGAPPRADTVFEGADPAARFALPPYAVTETANEYDVFFGPSPDGTGWTLTVHLAETRPPGDAPAAAPAAVRVFLRYLVSGSVKERTFDREDQPHGYKLRLTVGTLAERDELHAALTTAEAKPTLVVRRVLVYGAAVPIAQPTTSVDLVGVSNDGHVWHAQRQRDGTWRGFDPVGAAAADAQAARIVPQAARQPSRLSVFAVDLAGSVTDRAAQAGSDGSWHAFGASAPLTPPGTSRVAAAVVGGEVHLCGVAQGGLWFVREAPSHIDAPVDVKARTGSAATFADVACAAMDGVLHVAATTTDGGLLHTTRAPDGTWAPFDDVKAKVIKWGDRGHFARVACDVIGRALYVLVATSEGGLWITLSQSGTWAPLSDVKALVGDRGPARDVALASSGGERYLAYAATDGSLWHALLSGGKWTPFADVRAQTTVPALAFSTCALGATISTPPASQPGWVAQRQAFDDAVDFYLDPTLHAAVFSGPTPPSGALTPTPVVAGDWPYFRDGSQPDVFYYVPDAFKIQRRAQAPRTALMTAQVTGTTESDAQVQLAYTAAPVTDPARLAAASRELAQHVTTAPSLRPLELFAPTLALAYPGAPTAAGPFEPRDHALVSLRTGISDRLALSLDGFRALVQSFLGDGAQWNGVVRVAAAGTSTDVKLIARADDLDGATLDCAVARDAVAATVTVTVTNAIESPLLIESLPLALVDATGAAVTARIVTAPAFPVTLAPAS